MKSHHRLYLVPCLAAAVVACGQSAPTTSAGPSATTCEDALNVLQLPPSQLQERRNLCFDQDLTFSGELVGRSSGAVVSAACRPLVRGDGLPTVDLTVDVAGKPYELVFRPQARYQGQPLTLTAGAAVPPLVSLSVSPIDVGQMPWQATSGSLSYDPPGLAGTVQVDMVRDVAAARPVHLAGKWSCGKAPATVSPDPRRPLFHHLSGHHGIGWHRPVARP